MRECHTLLPLLEEMEKHVTAFYQALERASRVTAAARDVETSHSQQKQKWQVKHFDLLCCQENKSNPLDTEMVADLFY